MIAAMSVLDRLAKECHVVGERLKDFELEINGHDGHVDRGRDDDKGRRTQPKRKRLFETRKIVGVAEAVNVTVGMGDGEAVSLTI